jgi:hypothetical protein
MVIAPATTDVVIGQSAAAHASNDVQERNEAGEEGGENAPPQGLCRRRCAVPGNKQQ